VLLPLSVPTAFLAGILDDAVKSRRLRANPARGVENLPRKTSKRRVYLSADDIGRLAAESKHRVLVLVLALCGLRWGEAVALRVRDVQFLKRRITVRDNAVQLASDFEEGLTKSRKDARFPSLSSSWTSYRRNVGVRIWTTSFSATVSITCRVPSPMAVGSPPP
jgi:integrase